MFRDALVVGINNCQDDNLGNLNAPAEDAEAVSCLLEHYGEFNDNSFLSTFTSVHNFKHPCSYNSFLDELFIQPVYPLPCFPIFS